jgi:hypothetical protein
MTAEAEASSKQQAASSKQVLERSNQNTTATTR